MDPIVLHLDAAPSKADEELGQVVNALRSNGRTVVAAVITPSAEGMALAHMMLKFLPNVKIFTLVPDTSAIARRLSVKGPVGVAAELAFRLGLLGTTRVVAQAFLHARWIAAKDFSALLGALVRLEYELGREVGPTGVILRAQMTDIGVATGGIGSMISALKRFLDPNLSLGLETYNASALHQCIAQSGTPISLVWERARYPEHDWLSPIPGLVTWRDAGCPTMDDVRFLVVWRLSEIVRKASTP